MAWAMRPRRHARHRPRDLPQRSGAAGVGARGGGSGSKGASAHGRVPSRPPRLHRPPPCGVVPSLPVQSLPVPPTSVAAPAAVEAGVVEPEQRVVRRERRDHVAECKFVHGVVHLALIQQLPTGHTSPARRDGRGLVVHPPARKGALHCSQGAPQARSSWRRRLSVTKPVGRVSSNGRRRQRPRLPHHPACALPFGNFACGRPQSPTVYVRRPN